MKKNSSSNFRGIRYQSESVAMERILKIVELSLPLRCREIEGGGRALSLTARAKPSALVTRGWWPDQGYPHRQPLHKEADYEKDISRSTLSEDIHY